ncbi:FtsX-like permease family protein [Candidatus Enterococcus mansonii]|uniref:ABC3 transporter permease protein domain-containing protein n=1 Tax=Candidatus Enterococcus mansonii TaxID=1834181 RepID=A0A242CLC2_9ENTE|nr:FtsX-like permease family protein [Enterococcus sp. 4G2_DIV0659]OTO10582.1 hypothetical protein A5880_001266 [Enterococcus sp. 4G2_DIV0659]
MKNIRYAFASVSYHKKLSFSIGICSFFFLFFLTCILNLIDLERILYNEVNQVISITDYFVNYQKIMQLYTSFYIIILLFWVLLITLLISISLRAKKQDMLKWRFMGFSNGFIMKQAILETLIPVLAGILTASLFFLVCQHTYEFLLIHFRPLFANGMNIKPVSFFSSSMTIESTPSSTESTSSTAHFLSLTMNLPDRAIFNAFLRSTIPLVVTTVIVTLFLTYSVSRKSKQVIRM